MELTEQQIKDKFALESLLASNSSDDSIASKARRRKTEYTLNKLNTITTSTVTTTTTTVMNNSDGTSATGTAQYASNGDGTYLGQFLLTGYCPCVLCCGKSNGITASGKLATSNHTIAADSRYAFGTKMIIMGQVYTVEDRGGAIIGNHIDVFFNTHAEALQFGTKYADVYLYTGSDDSSDESTSEETTTEESTSEETTTEENTSDSSDLVTE